MPLVVTSTGRRVRIEDSIISEIVSVRLEGTRKSGIDEITRAVKISDFHLL